MLAAVDGSAAIARPGSRLEALGTRGGHRYPGGFRASNSRVATLPVVGIDGCWHWRDGRCSGQPEAEGGPAPRFALNLQPSAVRNRPTGRGGSRWDYAASERITAMRFAFTSKPTPGTSGSRT